MKPDYILTFAAGAAIGAASVFCYLRGAYKKKLEEAISQALQEMTDNFEEMKADLEREHTVFETTVIEIPDQDADENNIEPQHIINAYSSIAQNYTGTGRIIHARPYIISPDDVEDIERLTQLVFYANGVLVNEYDEPIEDVDDVVGKSNLDHFGERDAGPDEVFVRNDKLDMDFLILRSLESWGKEVP